MLLGCVYLVSRQRDHTLDQKRSLPGWRAVLLTDRDQLLVLIGWYIKLVIDTKQVFGRALSGKVSPPGVPRVVIDEQR